MDVRIKDKEIFGEILQKHNVEGGFEIYDNNKEIANFYNKEACSRAYPPGDLYHIFLAMIGLEEAKVLDENKPNNWLVQTDFANKEQTLTHAFQQNDTSFFRYLHQQLGNDIQKSYLDSIQIREDSVSSTIFWNDGTMKITPDEFVGLMKRLYFKELPAVSGRVQTIMNSLMLKESTDSFKLYYHTANIKMNDTVYQQVVGFVEDYNVLKNPKSKEMEKIIHPYFFALVFTPKAPSPKSHTETIALLKELLESYQVTVR